MTPSKGEILASRARAVENGQIIPYFQPQYNHSTGMLLGAEALARWLYPGAGVLSPIHFVPDAEADGFITQIDLCVFEQVCAFLRHCAENKRVMLPISVNVSRKDLFVEGFVDRLEEIRGKYGVDTKYIHLELTETAVAGHTQEVIAFVNRLHKLGYKVMMDDFGSGLSSLNVLKDVDFDALKLDMAFLTGDFAGGKGGVILSSVVRMAKWLGIPVIAEGVENVQQADFMRSIGCDYIQGYLYARPMSQEEYEQRLSGGMVGTIVPQLSLIDTLDAGAFWSPESQETLIFNNYVGGAAIFEYADGKAEILRVNQKYLKELGMNLSEKDLIHKNPLEMLDEENYKIYVDTLRRAIETEDEQECETWRTVESQCCGADRFCIRSALRMIGKSDISCLFYATIRNVTAEKNHYNSILDSERRFKMASEQVNIYYWEYTVATHEMRPCFRCMRDLGLPALVTNYPEPAIEMGIFPPEVADMYRDWHRQIDAGADHLEAVMPLTVGRVPFLVRYTTEFDELGHPVKAYGSAALVVNDAKSEEKK